MSVDFIAEDNFKPSWLIMVACFDILLPFRSDEKRRVGKFHKVLDCKIFTEMMQPDERREHKNY